MSENERQYTHSTDDRLRAIEARLAALEAANDPVQDDAGCGFVYTESDKSYIHVPPEEAESEHEPTPKQPRFTQSDRFVIDHELRQRTDCGSGSHAANTALVLNIYTGNIGAYKWEPMEPEQPPVPDQPKRRRVWVNEYPDEFGKVYSSKANAQRFSHCTSIGQVEFVEVLPGDGDVFAERDVLREQMEVFADGWICYAKENAKECLERADKAKGGER